MFIIKTTRFEFAYECGGVYLRLGSRDWHWSLKAS
jgi:hypothetical protein